MDQKNTSIMLNGDDRRAGQFDKVAVSETMGRKDCVESLLLKLIPQGRQGTNDDDLRVISVVDSEPTGKTALVRSVYNTLVVKRWFAYRAWVGVQDNFSARDVLANILRQISTQELQDVDLADEIELSWRLHAYFFKQRYLIVIDNTNSIDFMAMLLRFLIRSSNGSRVIITTRNDKLPYLIDPWIKPIKFHSLTEEVKKQLLSQCSSENELNGQDRPARLNLIGRILSWCSLSPSGFRLLGGLRSVKQQSWQFEAMIDRLSGNPLLEDILSLCYNDLSESLKSCIVYVCQFPRENEIPTRRLLRLWLAENIMPASHRGIQDAKDCFQELVDRNMIHVISRGKGHGFAKTCRMPGFIYDFLLPMALETRFFQTHGNDSSTNTPNGGSKFVALRIVLDKPRIYDRLGGSSETREQSDQRQYDVKQLRSYISFNTKKIRTQKAELDIFLINPKEKKSSLEVLDLEGVYKPVLPKNLGEIFWKLKYLGLRWTILHELPKSVGDLPCLETLDVKHTNISKIPSSIWTKESLRHLYLNGVTLDDKSIPHRRKLSPCSKLPKTSSLQTLCGLRIQGNSPMLDVLRKSTGITKLSLTLPSTVVNEVIDCIRRMTSLQSLRLKSKDLLGQPSKLHVEDMNNPPKQHLENMKELTSLSNLYLFGDLRGNSLSFLPKCLKSLTLSMSFLAADAMDFLTELKFLTELRLYAFSYGGTTLTCARGQFSQLRILKLWKLDNLESFDVQEEAMPNLEELDIRDCQKLGKILVLGDRKALREVSLELVKKELAMDLEASLGRSVVITTDLIASATTAIEVN